MPRDNRPPPRLRLVENTPEPKWSGRRSILVMVGLGALLWLAVAGGGWLLARLLS